MTLSKNKILLTSAAFAVLSTISFQDTFAAPAVERVRSVIDSHPAVAGSVAATEDTVVVRLKHPKALLDVMDAIVVAEEKVGDSRVILQGRILDGADPAFFQHPMFAKVGIMFSFTEKAWKTAPESTAYQVAEKIRAMNDDNLRGALDFLRVDWLEFKKIK